MFGVKLQGAFESLAELIQEMQGTAKEGDIAADRFSARETGDRLVGDCLENRGGQVFAGRAFVDEGLDICLRENAAAGGDIVNGRIIPRERVEAGGIRFQKGSHLVDKGSCSAGTDAVHPLFRVAVLEVNDLGVFPAQFDRDVRLRIKSGKTGRNSDDFLHERDSEMPGQCKAAGSGDHRTDENIAEFFVRLGEEMAHGLLYIREMPAVAFEKRSV